MPTLPERLHLLTAGPSDTTAAVLLLALPLVAPDELASICTALAETGVERAIVAAVAHASKLNDEARQTLADRLPLSEPSLRSIIAAGEETTAACATLLARRRHPDAAVMLARLVALAPWPSVRAPAAEAVLSRLSAALGPTLNAASLPASLARHLDEALAEAVDTYPDHRGDAVLHALALMARHPGAKLAAILADAGHPAMFALRHAVGRPERPELRRQLLRLIGTESLTPVIQRNLHRVSGSAAFDDLLSAAHLLRSPARKRLMRSVDRPMRCVPTMPEALAMSEASQSSLPTLIEALGLPTSRRIEHLADLVAVPSTLGRIRAVMALNRFEPEQVVGALKPLTLDRSPWVARCAANAALRGLACDQQNADIAAGLLASPHAAVVKRARTVLSRCSASLFFTHWLDLEPAERMSAAMAVIASDERNFLRLLSAALDTGGRAQRIAAIALAHRLRLSAHVENELIVLAGGNDPHIASAAVSALGEHDGVRSREAVRVALRHADVRVRANAVEALARQDHAGAIETMAALSEHRHNRLRANSVLGLLRRRQPLGAHALRAMLADADPMHRVSGIWVTMRTGSAFAKGDLRMLAERDARLEVRRRAATALRRFAADRTATAPTEVFTA